MVRIGVDRSSNTGYYFLFGNPDWTSLKDAEKFSLSLRMGDNSPWDAPASVVSLGGSKFLRVILGDSRFWNEFTTSSSLKITKDGTAVAALNLPGSAAAFNELAACQKFADQQIRAADPFAH